MLHISTTSTFFQSSDLTIIRLTTLDLATSSTFFWSFQPDHHWNLYLGLPSNSRLCHFTFFQFDHPLHDKKELYLPFPSQLSPVLLDWGSHLLSLRSFNHFSSQLFEFLWPDTQYKPLIPNQQLTISCLFPPSLQSSSLNHLADFFFLWLFLDSFLNFLHTGSWHSHPILYHFTWT